MVRDSYIAKKTSAQLREVFSAKIDGTLNLDEASRDIALDCFIVFSSIAGAIGNVGQADYAAANAFMDIFAHRRNALVAQGKRRGRTLSVNWPLWDEGGMQVDASSRALLARQFGMHPLGTAAGVSALRQLWASGETQAMVAAGDAQRIREVILGQPSKVAPALPIAATIATSPSQPAPSAALPQQVGQALVGLVSALIKVRPEDIDGDTALSEYGFDSVSLTEFGNAINQRYQLSLQPTIFFEYPTLDGLTGYLLREHPASLASHDAGVGPTATMAASSMAQDAFAPAHMRERVRTRGWARASKSSPAPASANEPIAIIGMSGQFPQAPDLDTFWRNLLEGRDCIDEIPRERWDWRAWHGDPAQDTNRTNIKWGGFIDDVDKFDPMFFGISPKEAELMDPQQRLMMMHIWKALEDAGYAGSALAGSGHRHLRRHHGHRLQHLDRARDDCHRRLFVDRCGGFGRSQSHEFFPGFPRSQRTGGNRVFQLARCVAGVAWRPFRAANRRWRLSAASTR